MRQCGTNRGTSGTVVKLSLLLVPHFPHLNKSRYKLLTVYIYPIKTSLRNLGYSIQKSVNQVKSELSKHPSFKYRPTSIQVYTKSPLVLHQPTTNRNNGFLRLFLRDESFTLTLIMSEGSLLTFQKPITMASYLSIFIHHVIVHEEAWMHFASYLETFLF